MSWHGVLLLLLRLAASSPPVDPSLPYTAQWVPSHVDFPRICVLARTRIDLRMERMLPAFLSSLLASAYPALDVFLVDTEFVSGDGVSARSALAASGARALDAAGLWGAGARVFVPALHPTDLDVTDPLLAASGWASRPEVVSGGGGGGGGDGGGGAAVHAKTARWTRAWVATDIVMNRLLKCGGRVDEACAWDFPDGGGVGGGGGANESACDYVLVTNTDNLYAGEFFPEVWSSGIAPLWPGTRAAFWGSHERVGRDIVGVHYVTYYTSDGGVRGGGDPRTRFQGRRVYFPLSADVSGQSLDLGALVWSARALRDAGGGSYVVAALRRGVRSALADAARAGGGAIDVEGALAHVWPTVYARDHIMASQVHVGVILRRRLSAINRVGDTASARALADAAVADGFAPAAARHTTAADGELYDDPVIVLPGLLFLHQ